ncbi:unnamed protein product [Tilletia laevis]|uniref:PITH domain-containing protein n=2 Tax=Tilletia TaxID=13289 RepID=A0A8X7MJY0_9BASI|nr:hypothetical protein A4X06_0g8940 [Tilletia controversa]CAD6889807.1 unnamed protein product [Tilletia caries]CAD6964747.1 unnamed protein product [Tilletia laevis]CAD6895989.1 unnamed protein product [Tilletia controversa]CAD6920842.1 unnamed protein product [Tilletia controversa]
MNNNCNDEVTTVDLNQVGLSAGNELNLYEYIDKDHVWGLNLAIPESARQVIKPWNERNSMVVYVESLVDDQFIINVPFTCPCRIKSILLKPGRGDLAPQRCRAYVNRFDEVEATSAPEAPSLPPPPRTSLAGNLSRLTVSASAFAPSSSTEQRPAPEQQHYVSSSSSSNRAGSVGVPGTGKPQADFALLDGGGLSEYPSDTPALETGQLFYLGFRGTPLVLKKTEQADFDVSAAFELTNWYIRFKRRRLKGEGGQEDWLTSLDCLFETLFTLCRTTDASDKNDYRSLHFLSFPSVREDYIDEVILRRFSALQSVTELVRTLRERNVLALRVPLKELVGFHSDQESLDDVQSLSTYITEEPNVHDLVLSTDEKRCGVGFKISADWPTLGRKLRKDLAGREKVSLEDAKAYLGTLWEFRYLFMYLRSSGREVGQAQ